MLHDFSTGGSERIAIRLANRWADSGRRVTLFCGTEQGAARALVSPAVHVEMCQPETVRSPWSRLQLGWRLAKQVRFHSPDIVFSPGNFHMIVLAILARTGFAKRPVFLSKLSNPIRRSGFRRRVERVADAMIRTVARPVDGLIAMSPAMGDEARLVFGSNRVIEILEPVLDDETAAPVRIASPHAGPLIIAAGRLCAQKDFMTALRAFALLPASLAARLLILGEGPLRPALQREGERLNIADRLEMPGHVSDVLPYFAQADLLVMTSRYEGYPAVLIEAIAAGLPIVTTDCSLAIREVIPADCFGTVVNSRDPIAIAAAINDQLKRPRADRTRIDAHVDRHRIGASAKAYLELFDRMATCENSLDVASSHHGRFPLDGSRRQTSARRGLGGQRAPIGTSWSMARDFPCWWRLLNFATRNSAR